MKFLKIMARRLEAALEAGSCSILPPAPSWQILAKYAFDFLLEVWSTESYWHAFHVDNFDNVLKHSGLFSVVRHMHCSNKPMCVSCQCACEHGCAWIFVYEFCVWLTCEKWLDVFARSFGHISSGACNLFLPHWLCSRMYVYRSFSTYGFQQSY